MARRLVAALAAILAFLVLTPDRLSGDPTTTTTATLLPGQSGDSPNPLQLYPRRPGAKYEDVEARPGTDVVLGLALVKVHLATWGIEPHSALPGGSVPADVAQFESLGLADGYSPFVTNTSGDLLHVDVREAQPTLSAAISCAATLAADGTVLLPYDRPPPPNASSTTSTSLPPVPHVNLYFPIGAQRGRVFVVCRAAASAISFGTDIRAVWAIDV